jgi:hypothetical protein
VILREGSKRTQRERFRRSETIFHALGESISQGSKRPQSHEVDEKAKNPRGACDLFGDTQLPAYFKAPKASRVELARPAKVKGEERSPRGGSSPDFKGLDIADEDFHYSSVVESFTRHRGREILEVTSGAFGFRVYFSLRRKMGQGFKVWAAKASEGREAQERNDRWLGATRVDVNGFAGGSKLRSR